MSDYDMSYDAIFLQSVVFVKRKTGAPFWRVLCASVGASDFLHLPKRRLTNAQPKEINGLKQTTAH